MLCYTTLLRALALFATAVVVAGCVARDNHHAQPQPRTRRAPCDTPRQRVMDLTQPMQEGMPFWPGGAPFKMTRLLDYPQGYRLHKFEMGENTGTHVDAPGHFIDGKTAIASIPVDQLVVAAVVMDMRSKTNADADYQITANDLLDFEAAHGEIPVGSLLIANTGWHARFSEPEKYLNKDADGVMHFPGFAADAAKLLVERDIVGVGIDTMSVDPGPSTDFPAHKVLLAAGKYQLENLANLDDMPTRGATVIVGVLPVVGGSQAQARVLALVPEQPKEEHEP